MLFIAMRSQMLGMCSMLLLCGISLAQQASEKSVAIAVRAATIDIQISNTSKLSDVLDELCARTGTECEGNALASGTVVAPGRLTGTWILLVGHLMDGSRLNYLAVPPYAGRPGRLLIEGAASTVDAPRPELPSPVTQAASDVVASPSPSLERSALGETNLPDDAQTSSANGTLAQASPGQVTAPPPSSTSGMYGSPLTSDMSGVSANAAPPQFLPFPDSRGNLIPVAPYRPQFLPFPDADGNLIPAKEGPTGSPFPSEIIVRH